MFITATEEDSTSFPARRPSRTSNIEEFVQERGGDTYKGPPGSTRHAIINIIILSSSALINPPLLLHPFEMIYNVVSLTAATSTENLQALEEVKDFCTTDLGRGGKQRWTYHLLSENAVDGHLQRLCDPRSSGSVDSVTFQPCTEYANLNQDRYTIEEWSLRGGIWQFNAVYDGHCGHDTVNLVCKRLPSMIRMSLQAVLNSSADAVSNSELISETLKNAVRRLDGSIRSDLLDFLPYDRLCEVSPGQLKEYIRRHESKWETISARCTQGATVVFSLLDPQKRNLWVLNLGDSQAVLGRRSQSGEWSGSIVNALHNGNSPLEHQRIVREHPGERSCVADNRVIGYLAPTRAVGDTWLKIPSVYTRRAFGEHMPDWMSPPLAKHYAGLILTPPYVSDVPDVYHLVFDTAADRQERFLILSSDGLPDLYDHMDAVPSERELAERWARIVGSAIRRRKEQGSHRNLAFDLLRDAIGGDDIQLASRNLTLEMDDKWIDDVTILVQRF